MTDYALPSLNAFLDEDDRETLRLLGQRQTYTDGMVVHRRGEPATTMGIVIKGSLKMVRQTSDGRQVLLLTINPGQHYADTTVMLQTPRTHTALASGQTVIDHYSHDSYLKLLDHPGILRALYQVTMLRLGHAIELFDDIRTTSPEVRLAKTLLTIRRSMGGASQLDCVQEELASLMGVSAMTLSKALKNLRMEGLIETGYRTVTILDPARFHYWLAERTEV